MKKIIIFLFTTSLFVTQALATQPKSANCFIAKENGRAIISEGDCATRYGPQSTFKIVLSLIGFDSGILKNESQPVWGMPDNEDPYVNVCKGDHNPRTWMRDSCLWYSRILTKELGMDKFQNYITQFSYGNQDVSGGLTTAWVSSSLKISPNEQTEFLQKLVDRKLNLNNESYDKSKKVMFIQEMAGGWNLYAKTGNGALIDKNGNKTNLQQGWFVGYIEKGDRRIVFASHLVDSEKQTTFASFRARNEALNKLWSIIDEIEK